MHVGQLQDAAAHENAVSVQALLGAEVCQSSSAIAVQQSAVKPYTLASLLAALKAWRVLRVSKNLLGRERKKMEKHLERQRKQEAEEKALAEAAAQEGGGGRPRCREWQRRIASSARWRRRPLRRSALACAALTARPRYLS